MAGHDTVRSGRQADLALDGLRVLRTARKPTASKEILGARTPGKPGVLDAVLGEQADDPASRP